MHAVAVLRARHRAVAHAELEHDALALQQRLHLARHVFVFSRDQAVGVFEYRHLGAEAADHLRELQADVAAADHDQVLRQLVEIHHRHVRQVRQFVQSRPVRHHRPTAGVDEYLRRFEHSLAHLQRMRRHEARVAPDQLEIGRAGEPLLQPAHRLRHHGVLARLHRLHVDADVAADAHTVVAGMVRRPRGARAGHQRLGRCAAVVDAGAAEVCALDQCGLQA